MKLLGCGGSGFGVESPGDRREESLFASQQNQKPRFFAKDKQVQTFTHLSTPPSESNWIG